MPIQPDLSGFKGRILAHRGWWFTGEEKNTWEALDRALRAGYGIETDVRDLNGRLVISHDPPLQEDAPIDLAAFLTHYRGIKAMGWLALNIKSDGLAKILSNMLSDSGVVNAFVFDMSVPDMRGYINQGVNVFSRRSDVETQPAYYPEASGLWLDCFNIEYGPAAWWGDALSDGKMACLVSPELHGRDHQRAWADWKNSTDWIENRNLLICTDFPMDAEAYFSGASLVV